MRIRSVKPDYFTSGKQLKVSTEAAFLFISLWTQADDFGRLKDDELEIASRCPRFVGDPNIPTTGELLDELSEANLLQRYSLVNRSFIQIHDWTDHQKISHPTPSKIPPPPEVSENFGKIPEVSRSFGKTTGGLERNGKERKGAPGFDNPGIIFWGKYPKRNGSKGNKQKAICAWVGLSEEEKTQAIAAIQIQTTHYQKCKKSGVFIQEFPDAVNWLKDRRWEDEIEGDKKRQRSQSDIAALEAKEQIRIDSYLES